MASPYVREASARLRARLALQESDRAREAQRLQAFTQVGQQAAGALQTGIQGIGQRMDARERLKQQLGMHEDQQETTRRGQDTTLEAARARIAAQSAAERRRAAIASLKSKLERLPEVASAALPGARAASEQRINSAMDAAEGPLRPSESKFGLVDLRSQLEKEGFSLDSGVEGVEGIDDATLRAALNAGLADAGKQRLAEDTAFAKYSNLLAGTKLTSTEQDKLVGGALAIEKTPVVADLARDLDNKEWEAIESYLHYVIKKNLPPSPALSLGGSIDASVSAILASAGVGAGAQASTGVKLEGELAAAQLEAEISKLSPKAQNFLNQVSILNRGIAKKMETRLTDKDWQWYENNLLVPMKGRTFFKDRFNSLTTDLHRDYELTLASLHRADVPQEFKKIRDDLRPAKIGEGGFLFDKDDLLDAQGKEPKLPSVDPETLDTEKKRMGKLDEQLVSGQEHQKNLGKGFMSDVADVAEDTALTIGDVVTGAAKDILPDSGTLPRALRGASEAVWGALGMELPADAAVRQKVEAAYKAAVAEHGVRARKDVMAPVWRARLKAEGIQVPPGAGIDTMRRALAAHQLKQRPGSTGDMAQQQRNIIKNAR